MTPTVPREGPPGLEPGDPADQAVGGDGLPVAMVGGEAVGHDRAPFGRKPVRQAQLGPAGGVGPGGGRPGLAGGAGKRPLAAGQDDVGRHPERPEVTGGPAGHALLADRFGPVFGGQEIHRPQPGLGVGVRPVEFAGEVPIASI